MWTGETKGINKYFARTSGGTFIPYNLALLAAISEKAGHQAKIIDGELDRMPLDEMCDMARDYDPDIVVLTGMTAFFNIAVECSQLLKSKGLTLLSCCICSTNALGNLSGASIARKVYSNSFEYLMMSAAISCARCSAEFGFLYPLISTISAPEFFIWVTAKALFEPCIPPTSQPMQIEFFMNKWLNPNGFTKF